MCNNPKVEIAKGLLALCDAQLSQIFMPYRQK
jgi:hypothetical protein